MTDFAEADKGLHLVLVAMHGFGHGCDKRNIGIGRDHQEIVVTAKPPQQAIEQRKPLGVPVQNSGLRQFDEFGRDRESAVRVRWRHDG